MQIVWDALRERLESSGSNPEAGMEPVSGQVVNVAAVPVVPTTIAAIRPR